MFKSKITLLDEKWVVIEMFKSRFKPSIHELIFSEKTQCYYQVMRVIHSLKPDNGLLLVVNKIDNNEFK